MKVILSCTDDPLYSFFLPLVTWSWKKVDVDAIVFVPEKQSEAMRLASVQCPETTRFEQLNITDDNRRPTYFQCSRLYAAALPYIDDDEMIITGDVDMAWFGDSFDLFKDDHVNIFGSDLVPMGQYPMCYIAAKKSIWKDVMEIGNKTVMQCLDNLLSGIECENMRGNYWSKDQQTIFEQTEKHPEIKLNKIDRRKSDDNLTASFRADRDGWQYSITSIIDAHLPRPGYEPYNFDLITKLFKDVYPSEHFGWMLNYRNAYLTLLDK
jgi:hypothetical protein